MSCRPNSRIPGVSTISAPKAGRDHLGRRGGMFAFANLARTDCADAQAQARLERIQQGSLADPGFADESRHAALQQAWRSSSSPSPVTELVNRTG